MKLRLIFGLLIASAGISLLAMDVVDRNKQLLEAIKKDNYDQIGRLLAEGRGQFSPGTLRRALWLAVKYVGEANLCKLLIENGADASAFSVDNLLWVVQNNNPEILKLLIENGADVVNARLGLFDSTLLMAAVFENSVPLVQAIVTTIPLSERLRILEQKRAALLAKKLTFRPGQNVPMPPKDVRRLITQHIINDLVDQQMLRVEHMLAEKNELEQSAYDTAIADNHLSVAELVNWNNPETRAWLRHELEASIRRLLFPPKEYVEEVE